jgi:hypothetical protein
MNYYYLLIMVGMIGAVGLYFDKQKPKEETKKDPARVIEVCPVPEPDKRIETVLSEIYALKALCDQSPTIHTLENVGKQYEAINLSLTRLLERKPPNVVVNVPDKVTIATAPNKPIKVMNRQVVPPVKWKEIKRKIDGLSEPAPKGK